MPSAVGVRGAARLQQLDSELADRLEHPEPRLGRLAHGLHKALVHQLDDEIQRVEVAFRICHLLDRPEVRTTDEDGQTGEHQPGVGRQQRMAPSDRVAQRPLPDREIPRPLP